MPKKKKSVGVSPSRKSINSETIAPIGLASSPVDLSTLQAPHGVNKEELFSSLSEMFSDLDPTVIYMVLSECDFRVEDTMDYLLELSTAAKRVTSLSEVSGFDSISASLFVENQPSIVSNETEDQSSSEIKTVKLNEESEEFSSSGELIYLLRNSFGKHYLNSESKDLRNDQVSGTRSPALGNSSSSRVKTLSECAMSSLGYDAVLSSQQMEADSEKAENFLPTLNPDYYRISEPVLGKSRVQANNPLEDMAIFAQIPENCSLPEVVLDSSAVPETITQTSVEIPCANPDEIQNAILDHTMLNGMPTQFCQGVAEHEVTAFDNSSSHGTNKEKNTAVVCYNPRNISVPDLCPAASFKLAPLVNVDQSQQAWNSHISVLQKHCHESTWNLMAPAFYPQSYSFVTPVAFSPEHWRSTSNYRTFGKIDAPQESSQCWDIYSSLVKTLGNKNESQKTNLSQVHQLSVSHMRRKTPFVGHVLVLLRGVPGSGKSYLARSLLEDNPGGIILSTDDYFYTKSGQYQFNPDRLSEAHEWNWKRAKEAFEKRVTPIIIDNTNIQAWEMKPYVALSQQHSYKVIFREPDTWWKFKPKELERRNIHGVSKEKIKKMLERYERCLTISAILNSSVPSELKSGTFEEALHHKKGQGKENTLSHGGKEPFAPPLKCTELSMDEKHLFEGEALENRNIWNEKREIGHKSSECRSECGVPVDDLDIYASPPRRDEVEPVLEMEVIKADLEKCEESTDSQCNVEDVQEYNNKDLDVQTEANRCSDVLPETEPTETRTRNQEGSDLEKSERPEILNFVGDWPVEQTMGQRLKRARRLGEHTIKNDEEDKGINTPLLDSLKNLDIDGKVHKVVLQENREEDDNRLPVCMSGADPEEDASRSLLVGDWPIQSFLEQRHHKMKRMPKRDLSESEEVTGDHYDTHTSVLNTLAVFPGTSESREELQVSSKRENSQALEAPSSEIISEKKPLQNKRTRKHNKLALTFTKILALGKPEEQLSLSHLLEEKAGEHSSAEASQYSQTEPKDFALLWRLERKMIAPEDIKVLHGTLDGFIPKGVDAAPDCTEKIPYKVTYDKSTYVEERELVHIDESENLNILCKLFGSFSFDALKDLYERCNRDIDWTTGILLDSAEKLCKDDSTECLQETMAQLPGMALNSQGDAIYGKSLADHPQITRTSGIIQNSEDENFSPDDGKPVDDSKLNAEILNLLTNDLLVSSVENKNFNHNVPSGHVSELDNEKPVLDTLRTQTKEITPTVLLENDNQSATLNTEIGFCVPATVFDYLNGGPITETETGNRSSEKHQECSEIKGAAVQALPENPVLPKGCVNTESQSESYKEMNCKPAFSAAPENEESKMPHQDKCQTKLLNPISVSQSVNIDCLELVLPPELAIQLNEIFGPVGVDSELLTNEDYVVHIDLNLAKEIHEKWKASIMKRQKREELHKLLVEDPTQFEQFCLRDTDNVFPQHTNHQVQKTASLASCPSAESMAVSEFFPFMDHWNVQTQKVSLRDIMSEEIALQEKQELQRFPFMATKDCAAILKEKQLLEMFPTISPNFLMDIFKDYNYSLEQTVQFLNCVLEADPVKTVVAKETAQGTALSSYGVLKSREKKAKKCKESDDILSDKKFQDFRYPGYDDFRAEAFLHQKEWHECLRKAGEAYRMGMKPVAAFYVQRGRLHEQKMKEANHDAAVQIFETVNASSLPENLLDLHGLHVDEALDHLSRVLQEKTEECSQAGGKPYLYVITGKGNHSLGGVARIRPAVIKYLGSHKFRFTEIKPGCLKVTLK
ncbi:PREDICTED: NEDD4-binding protein 2 [Gekko japonicus]|uniref:NEDD4-binding protein 2 n=1 Tax=Gekko japonicus TaxID=146911 RepID=A0ABM1KJE2_GEKJA|nr:PREDICTED: NEDD4-binding protein 2 [Gekko japonicus]